MGSLDIEKLMQPIAEDAPCGASIEYDPQYMSMEQSAAGTAEHQVGDSVIEAEEPNWRDIRKTSLALMEKGRDLRVILYLTLSGLRIDGMPGFRDGIVLLNQTLKTYWDSVWPQLDPDDDNDPLERMNIVASLSPQAGAYQDPMMFPQRLQAAPLSQSRQLGAYSLRDMLVASGEISSNAEKQPDQALIDAAFEDTPIETLQENFNATNESVEAVNEIDEFLTTTVGSNAAPDMSRIKRELRDIQRALSDALERRGYGIDGTADDAEQADTDQVEGERSNDAEGHGHASKGLSGEINSRREVLLAIDKICRYYEKNEPSSPVPLVIKRAKRLVEMSFLDILRDLSPQSLDTVQALFGSNDEQEGQ